MTFSGDTMRRWCWVAPRTRRPLFSLAWKYKQDILQAPIQAVVASRDGRGTETQVAE